MIMMFLNVLLTRMKMFLIKWVLTVTVDISSNCICESECHTHVISSSNIHSAIKLLKSGKNDGFDGLTSDYLLNASPLLYEYLSFLFTCMLHHSFSPSTFCISTMIPIPKRV